MDYEIVWNGSHKDVYLCVEQVQVRNMEYVERADLFAADRAPSRVYQDWSAERARALQLLPTRDRWRIRDLRCLLGLTPPVMSGILQGWRRERIVRSVGHGYIAPVRRIES